MRKGDVEAGALSGTATHYDGLIDLDRRTAAPTRAVLWQLRHQEPAGHEWRTEWEEFRREKPARSHLRKKSGMASPM